MLGALSKNYIFFGAWCGWLRIVVPPVFVGLGGALFGRLADYCGGAPCLSARVSWARGRRWSVAPAVVRGPRWGDWLSWSASGAAGRWRRLVFRGCGGGVAAAMAVSRGCSGGVVAAMAVSRGCGGGVAVAVAGHARWRLAFLSGGAVCLCGGLPAGR